jgi:hypothetical protein
MDPVGVSNAKTLVCCQMARDLLQLLHRLDLRISHSKGGRPRATPL